MIRHRNIARSKSRRRHWTLGNYFGKAESLLGGIRKRKQPKLEAQPLLNARDIGVDATVKPPSRIHLRPDHEAGRRNDDEHRQKERAFSQTDQRRAGARVRRRGGLHRCVEHRGSAAKATLNDCPHERKAKGAHLVAFVSCIRLLSGRMLCLAHRNQIRLEDERVVHPAVCHLGRYL